MKPVLKPVKRLAISGYGRIGRCLLRAQLESPKAYGDFEICAINELADNNIIAHLTRYDSVHGPFPGEVSVNDDYLTVINGNSGLQQRIKLFHQAQPEQLPWTELGIDLVMECSGSFSHRRGAEAHLAAGAQRLLFSQPAKPEVDATVVYGVNEHLLTKDCRIVSAASCTTNCIVPVIQALDQAFGVNAGVITTVHSAMNDQPVIDAFHNTDLRKTRSAINAIIPVDTSLAKGIDRILPNLAGRFSAQAMRVPTQNVSLMDLSVTVQRSVTDNQVNRCLQTAAKEQFAGVLDYTEELLASCDFNHNCHSGIIDASQTRVSGQHLIKVLTWFDNEWGYANRMLDVAKTWLDC